jgi:hypothetical protein
MPTTLPEALFSCTNALVTSRKRENHEWIAKWSLRIEGLKALLPSGSGTDSGTEIVEVTEMYLKLECSFHHLDEHGSYDGWTEHRIRATPTFGGLKITISGPDRNEIKDYLHDVYHHALTRAIEWSEDAQRWLFVD